MSEQSLLSTWRDSSEQPDARRLVVVHVVDCIGNGVQFSTLALYLNRQSGLSVWQIGLGLAIGGVFGLLSNLVSGRLSDRWGGRRLLATLLIGLGLTFFLLPLVQGGLEFVAFSIVYSLLHFSCGAPFMSLIGDAFGAGNRAQGRAMIRSLGNAGMTLGAGLSAVFLGLASTTFLAWAPMLNGVSFLVAGLLVIRLRIGSPKAAPVVLEPSAEPAVRPATVSAAPRSHWHAVFERGMPGLILSTAVLGLHSSLLATGIPLWISATHVAPSWIIPVLIGLNTVLVVMFQVPAAARSGESFTSAISGSRLAGLIAVAACCVLSISLWPESTVLASLILLAGFLLLTATELLQNGAAFYLGLSLGPDERRGEYASAFHVTQILESIVGPLAIGAVLSGQNGSSWLIFAALILVTVVIYRVVASRAAYLVVDDNRPDMVAKP
jgi:hypothetical protein